jgi:hypothetical protein
MLRRHIVLLSLLSFTAIASAQTPGVKGQVTPLTTGVSSVAAPLGAEDVVARLMSFDRNQDGRIEASELPDRMLNLLTQGDAGRDGALDRTDIRRLATSVPAPAPAPAVATVGGFRRTGGYTFGDEAGLSTSSHIDGALQDLMLASPAKEKAQAIVKTFVADLEFTASAELLSEMEKVLSEEQFTRFKAAINRQTSGPFIAVNAEQNSRRVTFVAMDLTQLVERFNLPPAERQQALAAVERHKARLRPGDAERSALLKQMKGILSDEERDDFRAALERRPIVKAGLFPGIVSGVVVGGTTIDRPVLVR